MTYLPTLIKPGIPCRNYHNWKLAELTAHPWTSSLNSGKPFVVSEASQHRMGQSLYGYLDLKIHELVRDREFRNLAVMGIHNRSSGISGYEKRDKRFNWQRPTAEIFNHDIVIKCFPGRDYVKHYASLIGTYLALHHKRWDHIRYLTPCEEALWDALASSNLMQVPSGDTAVLGYGLNVLMGENNPSWRGEGNFLWVRKKIEKHQTVFIGCKHSYWADVAGRIVTLLAKRGFKQLIYVGKLGALKPEIKPNEFLATGNKSFVDGEIVTWNNRFEFMKGDPHVAFGDHVSCPSIIYQTQEWLDKIGHNYAFVDPEIGHIAKAAHSSSIDFSYLHIVSDNLFQTYSEDLSNERKGNTPQKRLELLKKIKTLFELSLKN